MEIKDIIRAAGGPSRVAAHIGRHHATVLQWWRVPDVHARAVAQLAGLHPSEVRPDLYEQPPPAAPADPIAAAFIAGLAQFKGLDLTDAEIAKRLVVSAETVSRWRKGASRMSPTHAKQVETLFGISRHLLRPDRFEPPLEASAVGTAPEPSPPAMRGAA